jgi:hypothetical protein
VLTLVSDTSIPKVITRPIIIVHATSILNLFNVFPPFILLIFSVKEAKIYIYIFIYMKINKIYNIYKTLFEVNK